MEKLGNYLLQMEAAKKIFLTYSCDELAEKWSLKTDEAYLYVRFCDGEYSVDRKNGDILRLADGKAAGFNEVLSIFDLLCYSNALPHSTGTFAPLNSLDKMRVTGVGTDKMFMKYIEEFDQNREAFEDACKHTGGRPIAIGDAGFEFNVFADLKIRIKMYYSDEEFPAAMTILWDEAALSYLRYETAFYVMGFITERISITV